MGNLGINRAPDGDWSKLSGGPIPAKEGLQDHHGLALPDFTPPNSLHPKDEWGPCFPNPKPIQPIIPVYHDPAEAVEEVRNAPQHEQQRALVEFGAKLMSMDEHQLERTADYLRSEINKPYNTDDELLKHLLAGVESVQRSHDPNPSPCPHGPFPSHPWLQGGGRTVD